MTNQTHSDADTHGRVHDGIDAAKERANDVLAAASDAVDTSREKAKEAAHRAAEAFDSNPLGLLVGGAALGALVGAVLPRSQKERELLAPVGARVNAAATAAIAAAREAGRGELENMGLTRGAAKDQAKTLFQNLAKAATTAGKAAVDAGRNQGRAA